MSLLPDPALGLVHITPSLMSFSALGFDLGTLDVFTLIRATALGVGIRHDRRL
jgi:hypothetical protein